MVSKTDKRRLVGRQAGVKPVLMKESAPRESQSPYIGACGECHHFESRAVGTAGIASPAVA